MPERMRDDMSKKCGTPDKMRDKLPDEILDKMPMPIKCKINIYNIYIYIPAKMQDTLSDRIANPMWEHVRT